MIGTEDELLAQAAELREREGNLLRKTDEVLDKKELAEMQLRRRTDFEQALRMKRKDMRQWIRYAQFEVTQRDIRRARSIFERALQITHDWLPLWQRYIAMEVEEHNLARARNLLERVTKLLPRIEEFWFKYAALEERAGGVNASKAIFERWLQWQPGPDAWLAYIGLLRRHSNTIMQKQVASQFVGAFPHLFRAWNAWATPESFGVDHARQVYDKGLSLSSDPLRIQLVVAWAKLEIRENEYERARILLETAPGSDPEVRAQLAILDEREGIVEPASASALAALREGYRKRAAANPKSFDVWAALLSIDESPSVYEDALASLDPKSDEIPKLWARYSVFSEFNGTKSPEQILDHALEAHPESWLLWNARAMLSLRINQDFDAVRKIMGRALAKSSFDQNVIKGYIDFERRTHSTERVRKLYGIYCQHWPELVESWSQFANFESSLGEHDRARAILKTSTAHNPKSSDLWHVRCEFEADKGDFQYTRLVYGLWETSPAGSAQAYIEHAMFEVSTGLGEDDETVDDAALSRARSVFVKAHSKLPTDERLVIHDAQVQFEESYGSIESLEEVQRGAPEAVETEPGVYEFRFKSTDKAATQAPGARLLANAQKWAESKQQAPSPSPAAARLLENARKWAQKQS